MPELAGQVDHITPNGQGFESVELGDEIGAFLKTRLMTVWVVGMSMRVIREFQIFQLRQLVSEDIEKINRVRRP
jgi:hypothetical protein